MSPKQHTLSGQGTEPVDTYLPQSVYEDSRKLGSGFTYGLLGAIPGLGAVSNTINSMATGADGHVQKSRKALLGAVANIAGTYSLVAAASGAPTGALVAGIGLLAVSCVTGAQAGFR